VIWQVQPLVVQAAPVDPPLEPPDEPPAEVPAEPPDVELEEELEEALVVVAVDPPLEPPPLLPPLDAAPLLPLEPGPELLLPPADLPVLEPELPVGVERWQLPSARQLWPDGHTLSGHGKRPSGALGTLRQPASASAAAADPQAGFTKSAPQPSRYRGPSHRW
jgi:hypothetical protein